MTADSSDSSAISLSVAGLHASALDGPWARGVRAAIGWCASVGYRGIQLDASASEIRPRAIDRSARRDLAASVRRAGLGFTGLDLWIPPEHFSAGEHADRAHAALLGAIGLAADLRGLVPSGSASAPAVVSAAFPDDYAGRGEVLAQADAVGVLVEDFGVGATAPPSESAANDGGVDEGRAHGSIRPGIDTARLIMRSQPPGKTFAKLSKSAATLRVNDADDTGRREMGKGQLDVSTLLALHATLTPGLPIVTDLRGIEHPDRGARAAIDVIRSGMDLPGFGPMS